MTLSILPSLAWSAEKTCQLGQRVINFPSGEPEAKWNSLVSKVPGEQLSPLAIPSPIRALPIQYLNPNHQKYYTDKGSSEYLKEDAGVSAISMIKKANQQGLQLYVHSAYRSYDQQCEVFKSKVVDEMKKRNIDLETAIRSVNSRSAFPGGSEHQLATTIDFVTDIPSYGYQLVYEFYRTSTYQWLQENASEYGFVLSYPLADESNYLAPNPKTQIIFEPWHWRYIGTYYARLFKNCDPKYTLQEFLREIKKNSKFQCSQ